MKEYAILGIVLIAGALVMAPQRESCSVEGVYFCPDDDCEGILLNEIASAEKSVHVALYSFTLESAAASLKAARRRGVDVKIVVEKAGTKSKYAQYGNLSHYGIDIVVDGNPGQMHNKFVVVDGRRVITGSANWSRNSMSKNDENIIVLECREEALKYESQFWRIFLLGSYE